MSVGEKGAGVRRTESPVDPDVSSCACTTSDVVAVTAPAPEHSLSSAASVQIESPNDSLSATQVAEVERFQWPGHEAVAESYYHYFEGCCDD